MAYTQLRPHHTKAARVEEISPDAAHYLLSIQAGKADQYRLSQLDDYAQLRRGRFPLHAPGRLSLSARTSSDSIPGTWGFGFWNDPFGLSLGFGGNPFRFPALPNAAWFFGASEESYLSFKAPFHPERNEAQSKGALGSQSQIEQLDSTGNRSSTALAHLPQRVAPETNGRSTQRGEIPANGFLAQTFRSPKFDLRLFPAGLALPFSRKAARRWLGKVIEEQGIKLWHPAPRRHIQERAPGAHRVDPTQWHGYRIDWREDRVVFLVDDALVFESTTSPTGPLGLVIWIDNQYAAFTPAGRIGFGVLDNPEPAWLEIRDLEITSAASSA